MTGVRKCAECGKENYSDRYGSEIGERIRSQGVCFDCACWLEKVEWRREPGWEFGNPRPMSGGVPLVIDGHHYVAGTGNGPAFGGQSRPYIMLNDSTEKIRDCRNMWYQGEIPERFRDRLPDNARFAFPDVTLHPFKYAN